jgi:hypothetical protein
MYLPMGRAAAALAKALDASTLRRAAAADGRLFLIRFTKWG